MGSVPNGVNNFSLDLPDYSIASLNLNESAQTDRGSSKL
jgi:hypothetical protein